MSNPDRRHTQQDDPFISEDLRQMQAAGHYQAWLHSLLAPHLGRRILEVGPGLGSVSAKILPGLDLLVGVEPNPHCAAYLSAVFAAEPRFHLIQSAIEEADPAQLRGFGFDTVLCVNVLEHIQDDRGVIALFRSVLSAGGKIVLLVPAVPAAYGPIDHAVGHFRRYNRAMLRELAQTANLSIGALQYSNALGLAGWFFNAHVRKSTRQDNRQIALFDRLVPAWAGLERLVRPPAGLSLIAVLAVRS